MEQGWKDCNPARVIVSDDNARTKIDRNIRGEIMNEPTREERLKTLGWMYRIATRNWR